MCVNKCWKKIRAIAPAIFVAWLVSACATSHLRDPLPKEAVRNPDSMLVAFSVAGNELLRPHELQVEVAGKKGAGHQERLRIQPELAAGEIGVFVFSVPRQPITLNAVVLLSASGNTHWITTETGPRVEPGDSDGLYLGRLNLRAIRFLPYDNGSEKLPDGVRIEFSDEGAEDFPRLSGWQAIGASGQLETRQLGPWGREDFVGLRVMPDSRDRIYREQRLRNVFCVPKIKDFDEPCLD